MLRKRKKIRNLRPMAEVISSDAVRNAAQSLLANIQFSSVDEPIKTIAITSSAPNEGKSTVALSLAEAAGTTGKRVLVIEGDLRRRSIRATLDVHPRHGLHAVLAGETTLEEACVDAGYKGVSFLDSEPGIPNPEELLGSKRFEELLKHARESFDYIILDTPPVGAFADAAVVSRQADGTVFVVREGYTDKRDAQLAVAQLRSSGAHILGIVMNCEESRGSGRYGYYYGYYYEEKTVPADSPEAERARKIANSEKA